MNQKPRKTAKKKPIPKALRNRVWINAFGRVYFGACYCCEKKLEITQSWHCGHIIAENRGGLTHEDNLRPVCAECNLSLGTQNMDEFRQTFSNSQRGLCCTSCEIMCIIC